MSSAQTFFVCFSGFASFLLEYKKFFKLEARMFHFSKYNKYFRSGFFYFSSSASSISRNIRSLFKKLHLPKYKKNFLLRKKNNFLNFRARRFHFLKHKKFFLENFFRVDLFYFSSLG